MNHTTLAIVAIFATAVVLTTVAVSALPQQQAFAHYYRHHSHHHNHNSNEIRISQDINQLNNCTLAQCVNEAQNDVQIHHR
jgi:hypothetical protein